MPSIAVGPADYSSKKTPKGYVCTECGAKGVRLYREYQTFSDHSSLNCTKCALARYKKSHEGKDYDMEGRTITHEIGWMVAAVPTEEGKSYWGFTSVTEAGAKWWENLPEK